MGQVIRPRSLRKRNWRKHFKPSARFKLDRNHPRPTVFVAMSGGVDSSAAAYLLKREDYQVVGVFMKNWSFPEVPLKHCQLLKDYKDMVKVCRFLKIPYLVFNFEKEYKKRVMERFFAEYRAGRTPNPDVLCNTEIKFDLFLKAAIKQGADLIATGHHIRRKCANEELRMTNDKCKRYQLLKGKDPIKDQTYFVYNLTQKQLSKCLFPVGDYTKSQIRELAREIKLPTAFKRDSQGICFIGDIDVKEFLKTRIAEKPGKIVDRKGRVLGEHEGAWFYTVGQRRIEGLSGQSKPLYVVGTDVKKNLVIVGPDKATYSRGVRLEKLHWISSELPRRGLFEAKPRYGPDIYPGRLAKTGKKPVLSTSAMLNTGSTEGWSFVFSRSQRALTPGQSLVIYDKDVCLGGGVIKGVIKNEE